MTQCTLVRAQRIDGHGRAERSRCRRRARAPRRESRSCSHSRAGPARRRGSSPRLRPRCARSAPFSQTPTTVRAPPFGQPEHLLPGRKLDGERGVRIEHEGGAVEHEFVLSADLVQVSQRQPRLGAPASRPRRSGSTACSSSRASRSARAGCGRLRRQAPRRPPRSRCPRRSARRASPRAIRSAAASGQGRTRASRRTHRNSADCSYTRTASIRPRSSSATAL